MQIDPETQKKAEARARALLQRHTRDVDPLTQRGSVPAPAREVKSVAASHGRETAPAYERPAICGVILALAVVSLLVAVVCGLVREFASAITLGACGVSLFAWASIIDYVARSAFFTERTARLLERKLGE